MPKKKKKKKSFMDRLAQIDPEMLGQLFTSVHGMFQKKPGTSKPTDGLKVKKPFETTTS